MHVLDLGCGPGADLDRLALAVTTTGRVVGVDRDPRMVREARARALSPQAAAVTVIQADAHGLPLEARSQDRVWADRVLQHVAPRPGARRGAAGPAP